MEAAPWSFEQLSAAVSSFWKGVPPSRLPLASRSCVPVYYSVAIPEILRRGSTAVHRHTVTQHSRRRVRGGQL
jgi:hypothetical protein